MIYKNIQKTFLLIVIILFIAPISVFGQVDVITSQKYDNVIFKANVSTNEFSWEHSKLLVSPMEQRIWNQIDEMMVFFQNDERGAALVDYLAMFGIMGYELVAVQDIVTEDGDNVWIYYFSRPLE